MADFMSDAVVIKADALERAVADIFVAAKCARDEAERIARCLVSANLTGHDSHGVIRTPRYVQWLQEGKVRAGQTLTIVRDAPTHVVVDGNYGFGQTIAPLAVDLGIARAREHGLSVVGLRNSGHVGRVGDWGERAAADGLVSLHFVNVAGGELVAPFGGTSRRFSTNPICITVPLPEGPLVLDFATSLVAEGKVLVASNGGKPVPPGSLIEPDGRLSTDPVTLYGPIAGTHVRDAAQGAGALRAFGEHKGSGLAFMCELLAGCLTGAATSGPIPGGKRTRIANAMLSIYIDPGTFGAAHFADAVRDYAAYVKASRPATPTGEVLLPGDPERRNRADRLANGVPLQAQTWAAISATAAELGVTLPAV
ncbi:MAG TPA: malate/lactate/ureidoglycolate dehydrogenase [Acidisphaera sp.]|nr:malate/lactate/ureidoglycolate dehydrogenase [Acidisphaera sp.]